MNKTWYWLPNINEFDQQKPKKKKKNDKRILQNTYKVGELNKVSELALAEDSFAMNRVHWNPLWFSKCINQLKPHLIQTKLRMYFEIK